jgi:hypothetical protein
MLVLALAVAMYVVCNAYVVAMLAVGARADEERERALFEALVKRGRYE